MSNDISCSIFGTRAFHNCGPRNVILYCPRFVLEKGIENVVFVAFVLYLIPCF